MDQGTSNTGTNKNRRNRRRRGRGGHGAGEPAGQRNDQRANQGSAAAAAATAHKLANLTLKDKDTVQCTVCMDDVLPRGAPFKGKGNGKGKTQVTPHEQSIPKAITFPTCNHPYCPTCLTSWILATVTDRTLAFPTTCANATCPATLSPEVLDKLPLPGLSPAHRAAYRNRHVVQVQHLALPCPTPDCSAIIYASDRTLDQARIQRNSPESSGAPELPELRVQCLFCREFICFRCRIPSHKPMTCTEFASLPEEAKHHPEDFAVLRMGHVLQWKRCPGCAVLVDRKDGCNFIKCACGVGFCYRCGERYKSLEPTEALQHGQPGCGCELFDIPPDPLAAAGGDVGRLVHAPGVAVPAAQVRAAAPIGWPEFHDDPVAGQPEVVVDADGREIRVLYPIPGAGMVLARALPHVPQPIAVLPRAPLPQPDAPLLLPPATVDEIKAVLNFVVLLRMARNLSLEMLHIMAKEQRDLNMAGDVTADMLETAVQLALAQNGGAPRIVNGDTRAWMVDAVLAFALRISTLQELSRFFPKAADALQLDPVLVRRIKAFIAAQRALVPAIRPRDRAHDAEVYLTRNAWPRSGTGMRVMPHGMEDAIERFPLKIHKYVRALHEENTCHHCQCVFAKLEDTVTHLFTTTEHEVYLCCNRPFKELRGFVQHIREVHAEEGLGRLDVIVPRA